MKLDKLIKEIEYRMDKQGNFVCSIDDYAKEIYTKLKEYQKTKKEVLI